MFPNVTLYKNIFKPYKQREIHIYAYRHILKLCRNEKKVKVQRYRPISRLKTVKPAFHFNLSFHLPF